MTSFNFAALRADLSYCNYSIVNDFYHFPPLVKMKMLLPIAEILCGFIKLGVFLGRLNHIESLNTVPAYFLFSLKRFTLSLNS